jgi:hypothetical protein
MKDRVFGSANAVASHFIAVAQAIRSIKPLAHADESSRQAIERMKQDFLRGFLRVVKQANYYLHAVDNHRRDIHYYRYLREDGSPTARQRYIEVLTRADSIRRSAHEGLMSEMNALTRLARFFFSQDVEPDDIPDEFERIRERAEVVDGCFERIELPPNIFSPNNPPMGDRDNYSALAERITDGLFRHRAFLDDIRQALQGDG